MLGPLVAWAADEVVLSTTDLCPDSAHNAAVLSSGFLHGRCAAGQPTPRQHDRQQRCGVHPAPLVEAPGYRADRVKALAVREAPRRAACRRAAGRLHRPDNPRATAPHRNPERRPGAHRGGADCRRTMGPLLGGCQRGTGGADYEGADAERAVLDRPRSLPTRSSALVVHHGRQHGAASMARRRVRYDRRLRPGELDGTGPLSKGRHGAWCGR